MELAFTGDPDLTDTRISLSLDALRERIMLAITNDEPETLATYLEDGRVLVSDSWPWNDSSSQTLLHHAASLDACRCVDLLLGKGGDPYSQNDNGWPVLFSIDIYKDGKIIDVFLKHSVSLLDTDNDGWTIWHLCAFNSGTSASFMNNLFHAKPADTQAAVLIKTDRGHSPLALALGSDSDKDDSDDEDDFQLAEDNALSFITHCDNVPQFWENHGPILPIAFKFCSQKVIQRLLGLGINLDPFLPGKATPLHELGSVATPEWIKFLLSIFPDAVDCRYSDRLPLETYSDACIKAGHPPDETILKILVANNILRSLDENGLTPWEYICYSFQRSGSQRLYRSSLQSWGLVWSHYISMGAMQAYEEVSGLCGPAKLFSAFLTILSRFDQKECLSLLPPNKLQELILSSKHWKPLGEDVVRFLKQLIIGQHTDMIDILLRYDVNVHQRVDGLSAIEEACWGSRATRLCSKESGRAIIRSLLDHSNSLKLQEFTPDGSGCGLLHRIAFPGQEPQVRWLMGELVRRGVDINGIDTQIQPVQRTSPLVFHIIKDSTCYAEYLLDMQADPSVYRGHISVLWKLFALSQKKVIDLSWMRVFNFEYFFGGGKLAMFSNALHRASYRGFYNIVNFFVEKNLIRFGMKTASGLTALHFAALGGHPRIIEYLVDQGENVDTLDEQRTTPLHFAAFNGHLEAIKTLLKHGARGSISTSSWTPRIAASEAGHRGIVDLLDKELGNYNESGSELIRVRRHLNVLLRQMKEAIIFDDLENCRKIALRGCPLNAVIPVANGSTPLYLALESGRYQIARWLLGQHAITLTHCFDSSGGERTAIEYAFSAGIPSDILETLIDRYTKQGGDLIYGPDSLMVWAAKGSIGGMQVLLRYLRNHNKHWEGQHHYIKTRMLSRRAPLRSLGFCTFDEATALHVAVRIEQLAIVELLLENGADVNAMSTFGLAPIELSQSSEMISLLLRYGASRAPLSTLSLTETLSISGNGATILDNATDMINHGTLTAQDKDSLLGLDMFLEQSPDSVRCWKSLFKVRNSRNPFIYLLRSDSMFGNYLLCQPAGSRLFLDLDLHLENLDPFPWHRIGRAGFLINSFLRPTFRYFQRRFSQPTLRRWINLEPDRGWSPLCRAASVGFIDAMENCLSIGADIDFEGCSWGSALMIASACGRLESVKYLVRRGAKIDYVGRKGHVSAFSISESKAVRSWFLVERFVDQGRIAAATECETLHTDEQVGRRSGIAKIKVRLAELYYRRYGESSLAYAKRLELLKRELRGKVPYYYDGVIYNNDGE
ncbi:hypothetical protein F53441_7463 [Fusarium austroafricanum]|uniref:Ankyrin repeat protein n=1 Tax=Fusarium austroafricanum TaxID=2364996 RepID=A0A8H4NYD9_9HYPO|nr:hypothetical protein F53441_7463 [Fusarium austroafricanum]